MNKGVVAGVAVCSACVLVVLLALGWLLWRLWRKRKNKWAEYEKIAPSAVKNGKRGSTCPSMEAQAAINATLRCVYATNPATEPQTTCLAVPGSLCPSLTNSIDSGIEGSRASLNNYLDTQGEGLDTNHYASLDVQHVCLGSLQPSLEPQLFSHDQDTSNQVQPSTCAEVTGVINCSSVKFVCIENKSLCTVNEETMTQSNLSIKCLENRPDNNYIGEKHRLLFQLDLVYVEQENTPCEGDTNLPAVLSLKDSSALNNTSGCSSHKLSFETNNGPASLNDATVCTLDNNIPRKHESVVCLNPGNALDYNVDGSTSIYLIPTVEVEAI